jgi:hypothetical protein
MKSFMSSILIYADGVPKIKAKHSSIKGCKNEKPRF